MVISFVLQQSGELKTKTTGLNQRNQLDKLWKPRKYYFDNGDCLYSMITWRGDLTAKHNFLWNYFCEREEGQSALSGEIQNVEITRRVRLEYQGEERPRSQYWQDQTGNIPMMPSSLSVKQISALTPASPGCSAQKYLTKTRLSVATIVSSFISKLTKLPRVCAEMLHPLSLITKSFL